MLGGCFYGLYRASYQGFFCPFALINTGTVYAQLSGKLGYAIHMVYDRCSEFRYTTKAYDSKKNILLVNDCLLLPDVFFL